jgi:hypothetical protein
MTDVLQNPIIQYAFAGMSVLLLGIICWLIRIVVEVLRENQRVISENTITYRRLLDCIARLEQQFDDYEERADRMERRQEEMMVNILRANDG